MCRKRQSKSYRVSRLLLVALLLVQSISVRAQDEESVEEPQGRTFEQRMIDSNIEISRWFDGVADGIDLFLVGQRLTKKKNPSNIKIENSTVANEHESISNTTDFNANLRLPNVEAYWNLKFTSYDEKKEVRQAQQDPLRRAPRERNYGASVGVFRRLGNVRTSFQPRVELRDPLHISHSLSFENVSDFGNFQVNPKQEFFANPDQGTGFVTSLNFMAPLTKIYSFTWSNDGQYVDKQRLLTVNNGFSIGQFITNRSSLSYNISFNSNNRPNYHLESYTLSIGWSQLLYKNILDYSCGPHLDFPSERDFAGRPGFTLNINLNF